MTRNKEKRRKRIIFIITISIIVFSAVSLLIGRTNSKIEVIMRDSVSFIEYHILKKPADALGTMFHEYDSLKDVYKENAILKKKLGDHATAEARNKVITEELKHYKEMFDIPYLKTDYKVKYTNVQTRPADGWGQSLTIGLGSTGGIKIGMAVMSAKGMIGVVSSVTELSSTVNLLTDEQMANGVAVQIYNKDKVVPGILDRYNIRNGTYEITPLESIDALEKNALVVTSGIGKTAIPKGLIIGKAKDKRINEDGVSSKVFVKPAASFSDLDVVAVVLSESASHE